MARTLTDPGVQAAIEAFDLKQYHDALTHLVPTAHDEASRQALQRLRHTRRAFARPVSNWLPLSLFTWVGCGFRLIGEDDRLTQTHATVRWFTLFFLPIWPLRGYIVRETRGYTYEYLAEIPFDKRYRWAAVLVPAFLALVIAIVRLKG